jgi:predicted permease
VLPNDLGLSPSIAIDQRVLVFSLAISVLTALVFGLLPAWTSFRPDLARSLGSDTSFVAGKGKVNLRRAFVVSQIVASLVLLIANGIFLRTFQTNQAVSKNLESDKILLLNLSPKQYGYSVSYNNAFYRNLLSRITATPGVESATLANVTPLSLDRSSVYIRVDGRETQVLRSVVADNYFKTLNVKIMRGREFERSDDDAAHRVVIVNETMAQTFWPNENPLGKTFQMGRGSYEVIGVARDNPYNNRGKSQEPYLYSWLYQGTDENVSLIVRTTASPATMVGSVQSAVKELGANLPIFDFKTLDQVAKMHLVPMKAATGLLGILSLIGLIVASIGIYGVTTYAFNQRRKEIGIRMSLGAQRSDILKLIMREGLSLALVGIAIGTLLGLAIIQVVSHFLFGIDAVEARVFIAVALLLAIVALASSLIPAIAAARSNPVDVLRYE